MSGKILKGGSANDTLTGDRNANLLWGGDGNDILIGYGGNDLIAGGRGFDVARYSGSWLDYRITNIGRSELAVVADRRGGAPDGIDILHNVEALQFADRIIYLDGRNNAPHAAADRISTNEDTRVMVAAG